MDSNNDRALIFENAAGLANGANADWVLGQPDFTTCASGVSATLLDYPSSAFYDPTAQVLWLTDWLNNRVLMFGNQGQVATLVLGQPDFASHNVATTQTGMYYPHDVAVDPTSGKVFVAEQQNHRVLRFASSSALRNGAAAEAVFGQADFNSGLANRGGVVGVNTMNEPVGVHVDAYGRLWVADLSNHRVLRFNSAAIRTDGAYADGVLGQPDFTSNTPGTTQSQMNQPAGVYVDLDGVLWVSDYANHRVLSFYNAANKSDGANADKVLGQLDFTSNLSATTRDGMNHPIGLFVDPSGRLWVADFSNHRVLRFDQAGAKANGAEADGVLGQTNFTSGASGCSRSKMYFPRGIGGGPEGRLYVADTDNNRVLLFENAAALSNGANASGLLGQPVFNTCSNNTGGISQLSLSTPSRVSYDPGTGILWIADFGNNRVLRYGINLFLPVVRK
jgi:DNA-binding beta-propeller fold protein YncE